MTRLKKGDKIQLISPSNSGLCVPKLILKNATAQIKKRLGLQTALSQHFFEKDILQSSSIASRVEDLHEAFASKYIAGIACSRGGYNVNTLLDYIDWDLIKNNPKPIWGNSDITVLVNAIFAKTKNIAYIGPNLAGFNSGNENNYVYEYFQKCVMGDEEFEIIPSISFGESKSSFAKNHGPVVLHNGVAEGVVVGGHLSSLNLLQGTEYMPPLKNTILFIETDDFGGKDSVFEFERDLQSLLHFARPGNITGIIVGRFQKASCMSLSKLRSIFLSKRELVGIPIVANVNFGHTTPIVTLPVGGIAKVVADGTKSNIKILKH